MNDEEIIRGFEILGIQETDYPEYQDAESFASMITEIALGAMEFDLGLG